MTEMIHVSNVNKSFSNRGEVNQILENVSFKINKGEIVTLLGQSGCGKSTLLNMVGGFLKADQGNVKVDGHSITRPKKNCVMLFQQHNLLPWRSALKNVELGLEEEKISASTRREKAMEALKLVGLEDYAHHFPTELSGGMQQRVAIARAFAMEPDVILMDEPFAALDTFNRYHLQDELIRIQMQKKTTILIVTHDIDEAVYLSDRVLIMSSNPGRIFKDMTISLTKPRDRAHEDYYHYRKAILDEFKLSSPVVEPEYVI